MGWFIDRTARKQIWGFASKGVLARVWFFNGWVLAGLKGLGGLWLGGLVLSFGVQGFGFLTVGFWRV